MTKRMAVARSSMGGGDGLGGEWGGDDRVHDAERMSSTPPGPKALGHPASAVISEAYTIGLRTDRRAVTGAMTAAGVRW